MAINKVGSKGIEDGSVASADFAPNTVTSAKLQDGAVTNAKLTNSSVTLTGSSVSLGGSVSFNNKFVDWQSVITADGSTGTTAVSGQGYFIDTTSATHTLTLPASATIGDFIAIKDYAGTFATNNLTIARNGHNIQGVTNDSLISTNRASLVLVYVDSTKGWLYWEEHNVSDLEKNILVTATGGTVTESGDYKIHTFTGDGTFCVSAGAGPVAVVDYLVVAGGGGGGGIFGAGGGAGGYRESHSTPVSGCYTASPLATPTGIPVSVQAYPVTVGGGGAILAPGSGYPAGGGYQGSNSVFSTITSAGGGGRASGTGSGGSGAGYPRYTGTGASGNTPPVSPPQGNPGGDVPSAPSNQDNAGSGGGGAGAAGGDANSTPFPTPTCIRGGPGGNGVSTAITGSSVTRAGGGGGGTRTGSPTFGAPAPALGGSGGGGNGGYGSPGVGNGVAGTAGTANTGGGGGAGHYHACNPPAPFPNPLAQDRFLSGGNGGKGIVVIRYKFQ